MKSQTSDKAKKLPVEKKRKKPEKSLIQKKRKPRTTATKKGQTKIGEQPVRINVDIRQNCKEINHRNIILRPGLLLDVLRVFCQPSPRLRAENYGVSVNKFISPIKRSVVRILAIFLIFSLNSVFGTHAFLSDTESSNNNNYTAGILDFVLESPSDFTPSPISPGESSARTINILNNGNLFKYVASSTDFSGEICDYFNLEANVQGGAPEYTGSLKNFKISTTSPIFFNDPESWSYKLTLASTTPDAISGQICKFKYVYYGSQIRNSLPFGEGFSDFEEIGNSIKTKHCQMYETKTIGYWKNHSSIYIPLLSQLLGEESIDDKIEADNIFVNANANNMRDMLKAQLLAMKFNIAQFEIGDYYIQGHNMTINELVALADDLLKQNPEPTKEILENAKNILNYVNNLHEIKICKDTPHGCVLSLTKTAEQSEVNRGENITYHLTLDNIGDKVCTGSGVILKDYYDPSTSFVNYVSSRNPNSFRDTCNYLEWNFGNINPDDPEINIKLIMKVNENVQCNSMLVNEANYWSDQTDTGNPVMAESKVICGYIPVCGNNIKDDGEECDDGNKINGDSCNNHCKTHILSCDNADYVFDVDMSVVGDSCWNPNEVLANKIEDSVNVNILKDGKFLIIGEVKRGKPDQCQPHEDFYLKVGLRNGPSTTDDAEECAMSVRNDYLGEFKLRAGDNKIMMHTAAQCPPDKDANSVELKKLCLFDINKNQNNNIINKINNAQENNNPSFEIEENNEYNLSDNNKNNKNENENEQLNNEDSKSIKEEEKNKQNNTEIIINNDSQEQSEETNHNSSKDDTNIVLFEIPKVIQKEETVIDTPEVEPVS